MRAILIFPPTADPAHPPLGICSLAAYLRDKGEEVSLADLNLRAHNELLTAAVLARYSEELEARLNELEGRERLAQQDLEAYRTIAESLLSADFLTEQIDDARERLRDPATYASRSTYSEATSIVRRAMEFISAAYFPTKWCPGALSMSYLSTRSGDVLSAVNDRRENLFLEFLEQCVDEIAVEAPPLVGISLNYYCQMISAITLASLVKKRLPRSFLVVGGGLVCFFEKHWEVLAPFRHAVDGWIPFEGEEPLWQLVEALKRGADVAGVQGLVRFEGNTPVYRPLAAPPSITELPPPSFSGLLLREYLTPEPILPVLASRGCYWGRCAFCSHDRLYQGRFRNRSAADVLKMIGQLSRQYGARCFYFVDEAIPPKVALELAEAVVRETLPFQWFGEVRFERYFDGARLRRLHSGGCRMLMFGLESGVRRVLELMDKGVRTDTVAAILRNCAEAGIRTFVMFFVGFPTETRQEAEATLEFVASLRNDITHASFTQFILERYARVFRQPGHYGIAEIRPYPDDDLKTWCLYGVEDGLTADEAHDFTVKMRLDSGIQSISGIYLLSRSHLVFLPHKDAKSEPDQRPALNLSRPASLVPKRRHGLAARRLAFNLDEIAAVLRRKEPSAEPLPQNPTQYVFCPDSEILVDVGPDGINLLKACNGRFTLAEILEAVGNENRGTTLEFFEGLHERALIAWESRP